MNEESTNRREDPRALANALGVHYLDNLDSVEPSQRFVERIPIGFARRFGLLGLKSNDDVDVVIGDSRSWQQLDTVARVLQKQVSPCFGNWDAVQSAINRSYQQRTGQAQQYIDTLNRNEVFADLEYTGNREDLLDTSDRAPVIKLVNLIIFEAVKSEASDVHIQPYEERVVVRLRIDGILFDSFDIRKELQDEVTSRIKVLGGMNIAEKRLPQDGRATVQVGDRMVDLRIASLPANHGERVVIRLLDKGAKLLSLSEIGMDDQVLDGFRSLIHLEHGLILVTGPTGSGKTTTLYGALQEINTTDRNVITLEDPIEYQIDGISQSQINETKGMTFAKGLRNVLRQDPDIIMVGEIRDHETAVMAIQSALTGHLVFSTLHTNDAASAVTRLLDLGIEPYLVSSSLLASMAQRLVRRVCSKCRTQRTISEAESTRLFSKGESPSFESVYYGKGCERCRSTGYRGRQGIFELLLVDEAVRRGIQDRASACELRTTAQSVGMRVLREDGLNKIQHGITTVEEVSRVTMRAAM